MEISNYRPGDTLENPAWATGARVYDRFDAVLAAPHLAAYPMETADGESRLWAVVDPTGTHTGTYLERAVAAGEKVDGARWAMPRVDRLARFVAWRPERRTALRPTAAGHLRPDGKDGASASFIVEWVEPNGEFRTSEPVSGAESISVKALKARLGASAALPERDRAALLDGALTMAGLESQARIETLLQPGWVWTEDRWVFAAPHGSVDAAGLRPDIRPLAATREVAGDSGTDLVGWEKVLTADELRTAAGSLTAFIDLARTKATSTMTLLTAFSAPLQLTLRAGCFVQATPGSGKSLLLSRLSAFLGATGGAGARMALALPSSSRAGMTAQMTWARGLPVIADDLRSAGVSADRVAMAHAAVEAAAQLAYGSGAATMATTDGRVRESAGRCEATVILAGEELPTGDAITGRVNALHLGKDDVLNRMDGDQLAPVDEWRDAYATSGLASGLYGDWLMWLAARLDEHGADGLATRRREYDALATSFMTGAGGDRSHEIVGPAHATWELMKQWALDRGFADLLPTDADMLAVLKAQPEVNAGFTVEVAEHMQLMRHIEDMVQQRRGHFETPEGGEPKDARQLGWRPDDRGSGELVRSPLLLGTVCRDGEHLVVLASAIQRIWSQEMKRTTRMSVPGFAERLEEFIPEDARGKKRIPSAYYPGGSAVGLVLRRDAFKTLVPHLESAAEPADDLRF